MPLTNRSKPLTAFTVPGKGLFEFKVMPFGLHAAAPTFQRLLDRVITPDMAPNAFAYLDDIVVCTKSLEEHTKVLKKVFQKLYEAKLRPNPEKCHFLRTKLKYLGHVVDKDGLHTHPEKVSAIQNLGPPRNLKEARRFLGLISWYRRFIKDAARLSAPLHKLLKKKAKWEWTKVHQDAFDELKQKLTTATVLACPDWTKPLVLQTDASLEELGAVLSQPDGEEEHILAYASRSVSKTERNYSATELGCLVVKWAIWRMRDNLEGYHFTVLTDHLALKWLYKIDNPSGLLARWAMKLSQWDFEIKYRKGADNMIADALSRQPVETCAIEKDADQDWYQRRLRAIKDNSAGNPEYCLRNHRLYSRWARKCELWRALS